MTAHQDVVDALDKLATHGTADQIADHLTQNGHVGDQTESDTCPVANYVHATTTHRISIGFLTWAVLQSGDRAVAKPFMSATDTPDEVGRFIGGFDNGDYPALIRREAKS